MFYIEPAISFNDFVGRRFIAGTIINESGGIIFDGTKPIVVKSYKGKINKGEPVLIVGYSKFDEFFFVERYA